MEKNKHSKRKFQKQWITGKQIILGMRERGGTVIAWPVHNSKKKTFEGDLLYYVEEGATIYTDESSSYSDLREWYDHQFD